MEIKEATEWSGVRTKLVNRIGDLPVHNPDFIKLIYNLDSMVTTLSKLSVEHRRNPEHWSMKEQLQKINESISLVEKYILLTALSF